MMAAGDFVSSMAPNDPGAGEDRQRAALAGAVRWIHEPGDGPPVAYRSTAAGWVIAAGHQWGGRVDRRTKDGVEVVRLCCSRCGRVRWLDASFVGVPHCGGGVFVYRLRERVSA